MNPLRCVALLSVLLISPCDTFVLAQSPSGHPDLVIVHVTVVDTKSGSLLPDSTVVVRDQHIALVGPSASVTPDTHSTIVEGRGKYLIPGLWDMHVHTVFGDWVPADEHTLQMFVVNGITGVRDMGGELNALKDWRSRIAAGTLLGPRMIIAGPMLDGPVPHFPASAPIANAADGRRVVDDLKSQGVDFIKIQSYIPRDGYFAAATEAKKIGISFVGHVPDVIRASEASNAGQKSIEHFTGIFEGCSGIEDKLIAGPKTLGMNVKDYDPERAKALIALLAKNETWQVPTLVWERGQWLVDYLDLSKDPLTKYAPKAWQRSWARFTADIIKSVDTDPLPVRQKFVQMELDMTLAMYRAGVPFMAGTDTAAGVHVFPGWSLHQELELFVKAGLTPLQALQTATLNPARFLGRDDMGSVDRGKIADLVLLQANPLDKIDNTRRIDAVVLNGRYLSHAELARIRKGIEDAAAASK